MTTYPEIQKAAEAIRDRVLRTPLVLSPTLSRMFKADIYLKLENLQTTGSFKIRGATYKLIVNRGRIGPQGVVAASAGNHAQGVALAARQLGILATIFMPEWASISKQEATRAYGGKVIISGKSVNESLGKAKELADRGAMMIHPYDDDEIIAGQGTVALEILSELSDPDMILAPVGGGGLISGIATAVKAMTKKTKIIGVQAASCPSAVVSRQNGKITPVTTTPSIADGISVKQVGSLTFDIIQKHVDSIVAVAEESIASAVLFLLERKKMLAEGAGAVPVAALLDGTVAIPKGGKVVLVISGGNMDSPLIGRIINQGLSKHSRVMRLSVTLEDIPGSLAKLLSHVASLKANVLHIRHDRNVGDIPINMSRVVLELETRGPEHVNEIADALRRLKYEIKTEP